MQNTRPLNHTAGLFGNLVNPALPNNLADVNFNTQLFAAALLAGVTTHLVYFIRGEHHRGTVQIVKTYIALDILIALIFIRKNGGDLKTSAIEAAVVTTAYMLGLFGTMGIYRGFLHPLHRFSGPFLARFSNLYHSSLLGKSDNYRVIYNLHEQYGPIVRTGRLST